MILVTYSDQKTFLLTTEEFFSAKEEWKNKKSYWCDRLKADLTPYYKYAEVPKEERDRDILIEKTGKIERRVYKRGNKYFELLDNGQSMETELYGPEDSLVGQEAYYKTLNCEKKRLLVTSIKVTE